MDDAHSPRAEHRGVEKDGCGEDAKGQKDLDQILHIPEENVGTAEKEPGGDALNPEPKGEERNPEQLEGGGDTEKGGKRKTSAVRQPPYQQFG